MPVASQSAPFRAIGRFHWRLIALVLLVSIAAFALAQRRKSLAQPRLVGTTNVFPISIRHAEDAWYWRDQTKDTGGRLMRISASGSQVIAKADALSCYALGEGKLGWIERNGREWTVLLAESDGSNPRSLYKNTAEPMGIAIAQGRIYWLNRVPALARDSGLFPSLSPTLEVVSMSLSGGKPNSVALLYESEDGEMLGLHGNVLAIATYRRTLPGSFCLYRVPLGEAFPVRVAGERGLSRSLLTRDGDLYWTAPSKEVAGPPTAITLRRLDANGRAETLSDWLPLSGELYETTEGVLYGDRSIGGSLYPAGRSDQFPEPLAVPVGYTAVAAGEGLMLLAPAKADSAQFTFYEMSLP